jgi:hypothetical protein
LLELFIGEILWRHKAIMFLAENFYALSGCFKFEKGNKVMGNKLGADGTTNKEWKFCRAKLSARYYCFIYSIDYFVNFGFILMN